MSVSFRWEVAKPSAAKSFGAGTSRDIDTLKDVFGDHISSEQLPMLRAMHKATGDSRSLWGEIADTLERLQGDDHEPVCIKVWTEF